jgi:hypothetical protein
MSRVGFDMVSDWYCFWICRAKKKKENKNKKYNLSMTLFLNHKHLCRLNTHDKLHGHFFFLITSDIVKWNSSSHWSKLHFERHSASSVSSFDSIASFNRLFDRSLSSYTNSRLLITANNVKLIRLLEYLQDGVISLK